MNFRALNNLNILDSDWIKGSIRQAYNNWDIAISEHFFEALSHWIPSPTISIKLQTYEWNA